ncbi:hemolysin III family protein [Ruminococcus sp. OA3]|uniref:PAQR family membrane homeostasis protein TrhA n=1 Tax=Ruminococcus sp. OA3 TaxID=2914164 RepID=UPI001F0683AD|nr:hemolysin III family protein [Ruminococcus sp. OA3]MCH1981533.1 hemolysin III family protein [Ruminococcus sp. OA3]
MKERWKPKDPGSAVTHFIGMILALLGAAPLLIKAARVPDILHMIALAIFILSMVLLYAASTIYHTLNVNEQVNKRLKKMDHMMIFILIAGSYTPICLIVLHGKTGTLLCALVWTVAFIGILIKGLWINCPKWFSSIIYIGMGWLCVLAFSQILQTLSRPAFGWLLAGGIIYTIGGIIYALKVPLFNSKHKNFGSHEIFHLFVMGGSICHFILMYFFVAPMPV